MAGDILYLLSLGVTLEEIAQRAGRTTTAIQHELDEHQKRVEEEKKSETAQHKLLSHEKTISRDYN